MLNPCNPCVCPGRSCHQCHFGYRSAEARHQAMKNILLNYMGDTCNPSQHRIAETYTKQHVMWREEFESDPEVEKTENRFSQLAKDVRELYNAFRIEEFTEDEAVELTKAYLGIAFQDQMYRNMERKHRTFSKSELAARLNRYKEEHKEEEKS